ncbi:MAG TPA: hypothetical protein PKH79_13140 [Prolixibacteraceae bacterium]|nr:hypothetical protein [Prolixibacteraceae bacterium]
MKSTIGEKRLKIRRAIFGTLSFSAALFVFQACYGTLEDAGIDVSIRGLVTSKTTSLPIPGVKVSIEDQPQYEITDEEGKFHIYTSNDSICNLRFKDIDSTQNGKFLPKDTVLKIVNHDVDLTISLDVQ